MGGALVSTKETLVTPSFLPPKPYLHPPTLLALPLKGPLKGKNLFFEDFLAIPIIFWTRLAKFDVSTMMVGFHIANLDQISASIS